MKKNRLLFISLLLLVSINFLWSQTVAKWHTSMGDFEVTMREDLVPITVGNFVDLTNSNFYDNLIFHRVISDFMIQDGCPLGTGYGGPGYAIPDEFHPSINYNVPYVLGMANAGANTGGSQYFITVESYPSLNNSYSAFGHVTLGSNIVEEISEVPTTGPNGTPANKPLTDVVIDSIRIMTPRLDGYLPIEDTLYVNAGEAMVFALVCNEEDVTYSWFIDDELQMETSFILNFTPAVNGWHEVKGVVSNENYDLPKVWWIYVTGGTEITDDVISNNTRLYQNIPNPFNPETTIKFYLNEAEQVSLEIRNIKGQLVKTLLKSELQAGEHSIIWNGKDDSGHNVASGIYLYHLKTNNISEIKKAILLK
ncbi:MAG: peptidylprolyl isomerase [Candidatus Tenebribacter davisii]|nr:peptidylprolyl isomerase [Candidatus Tenebribacter davisii]